MKIQANNRLLTDSGLQDKAPSNQSALSGDPANPTIPAYLREVYYWAYLNSTNARLLDHDAIVSAILLGNNAACAGRLSVKSGPANACYRRRTSTDD